jgi:ligand-binding SRPBCC domain-containing protein
MDFHHTLSINRPIDKVWAFFQSPRSEMQWQPSVLEETAVGGGDLGVGFQCREVRKFLGKRMEATWEITEFVALQRVSFKSIDSAIPYEGSYIFERMGNGTKFDYTIRMGTAKGFLGLLTPITNLLLRKQFQTDLNRLRKLLETVP